MPIGERALAWMEKYMTEVRPSMRAGAMATVMLEGGADVRHVQEMLGHANLRNTEIYTHVAITQLKAVHARTHPGASLSRAPSVSTVNTVDIVDDGERDERDHEAVHDELALEDDEA